MPSQTHLLNRAYQLIETSQLTDAELVLEALILDSPQNLEPWKAYICLCNSPEDLSWLKERIILTREIRAIDKCELLINCDIALHELQEIARPYVQIWVDTEDHDEKEDPQESRIIFELLEEYQYVDTPVMPAVHKSSPQKAAYSFPDFGLGLLAIFFIAVRFLVLGYYSGVPLLILLLFGFAQWLDESSKSK